MKRGPVPPVFLAFSTVFCAACARTPSPPPARMPAPTLLTSARLVGRLDVVADGTIAQVLVRELNRDPEVDLQNVGVSSVDGVVTLQGTVSNRLAARRAVEIAHVVRGVRAVVDRISVSAMRRPDYELEFELAARIAKDPAISDRKIGVVARAGIVRLTGDVDSEAARRIAIADVLATPGVDAVVDDLALADAASAGRSDETLEQEAERTLHDDPWLDDARVAVAAEGGRLVLRGWVGSAPERSRAEQDARAASPIDVDASALRIDRWTDDGTLRSEPPTVRPDRDVAQALADAYVRDPRVHPFAPGVDVRSGVVVLTGIAPNRTAAGAAVEDARNVTGVQDVRDDLETRSEVSEADAVIRKDIESAMDRDRRLVSKHLRVEVAGGRVTLRGVVGSEQDRFDAIDLASSIPGVRGVEDRIALEPRLAPAGGQAAGRAEMQPAK